MVFVMILELFIDLELVQNCQEDHVRSSVIIKHFKSKSVQCVEDFVMLLEYNT